MSESESESESNQNTATEFDVRNLIPGMRERTAEADWDFDGARKIDDNVWNIVEWLLDAFYSHQLDIEYSRISVMPCPDGGVRFVLCSGERQAQVHVLYTTRIVVKRRICDAPRIRYSNIETGLVKRVLEILRPFFGTHKRFYI